MRPSDRRIHREYVSRSEPAAASSIIDTYQPRKWVTASEWFSIDSTWEATNGPFLIETYRAEVHPRQDEVQIVDITISLRALNRSLEFTGDVGLGYHAVEMEHRKAVDADTRMGELEVSGKVSAWATLSGISTAEMAPVGVAIFPHPQTARRPSLLRMHRSDTSSQKQRLSS